MQMKQIAKGVKFCFHQTDKFKTSRISFSFITPLNSKAADNALVIYLLSRTNSDFPAVSKMNKKLASLYGATLSASVSKHGDTQVLTLVLTAIDDRFALDSKSICKECCDLLCSCVFKPSVTLDGFSKDDVKREKRLLLEKIQSEKDEKRTYAYNRLIEEMCSEETYGISRFGKEERIVEATEKELFTRWMRLVVNSNIQINYIGSSDPQIVEDTVLPYFEKLQRKDILVVKTDFITDAYDRQTIEEQQDINQAKLVIGFRAGMTYDRDNFAALKLMTMIYGSGTFSKLFVNVREKMSLCYYCAASLIAAKGLLIVQSGVEKKNIDKALTAILAELEEMKNGNFTQQTLKNAKLSFSDSVNAVYDSCDTIDAWLLGYSLYSVYYSPDELIEMVNNVSREEIMVAASMVTLDTVYKLEPKEEVK